MFKSKIILAAVAVAAIAFGSIAIKVNSDANEIATLTSQVETLKEKVVNKQVESDFLASELELSEFTLGRVLKERESIAAIHAANDKEQDRLRTELALANAEVAELKVSSDEHTKDWANTVMPAAAVRLLKYTDTGSNNPDGDSDKDSSPGAATGMVAKLSTDYQF